MLIDDYSEYDYLKQPLEDYVGNIPKVRLLRTTLRQGLIRARMIGARQATGCSLCHNNIGRSSHENDF